MLKSGISNHKTLIHGNRYLEQFHFYNEFETALGENYPGLKYYLCGKAEMVVETRDILISKGIPFEHIISEIYF